MKLRSRVRAADLIRNGTVGLRARRLRSAFSALGVCIGVAAIVGVLGVSQSSQADLLAQIDRLGTNLLTVENQRSFNGNEGQLPFEAPAMIGIVPGVQAETPTAQRAGGVNRGAVGRMIPSAQGGGPLRRPAVQRSAIRGCHPRLAHIALFP